MKSLVAYSLGSILPQLRTKFHKELYGYVDQTKGGKYQYQRPGLLTGYSYEKPLEATLLLPPDLVPKITKHLKQYKAKFIMYQIR